MVKSKKRLEKSIGSYDKRIREHKEKIEKFSQERPWLLDYWKTQIRVLEENKEKEKRKLEK